MGERQGVFSHLFQEVFMQQGVDLHAPATPVPLHLMACGLSCLRLGGDRFAPEQSLECENMFRHLVSPQTSPRTV